MADSKDGVRMVLTKVSFIEGSLRPVGYEFTYRGAKPPKGAVPVGTPIKAKPVKVTNGDTKPLEAQAAVRTKMAQSSGN